MPGQFWVGPLPPFHTGDGTAVTASATLTELSPTPQIILPVPLLQEFAGKRLEIQAGGHYTTTATQGTITFDLRIGAAGAIGSMTSIAASAATTWVASQTNRFWRMEANLQIRTIGSAGTAIMIGELSNVSSGGTDMIATTAGSTAAVDTTSTRAIALGVTLSVASQSITCRYFGVRSVN
jgi:hypothetical protein